MSKQKLKPFVRGADGILIRNPKISPFDNRSYSPPDEALNVMYAGEMRLGCTHRKFENYSSFPCGINPKYDLDRNGRPTKCGVHSAAAIQRRKDKSEAKMQAWRDQIERNSIIRNINAEMIPLIQSIADGHNDPRTACLGWLKRHAEATRESE